MMFKLVLLVALVMVPAAIAGSATAGFTQPETNHFVNTEAVDPVMVPLSDEIDQNQPSGPAYMAAFSQGGLAQSFMQTNDNISGAGILLMAGVGTSDNVTIQLWDGLPNAGGTMITEGSATGTAGQWVDVYWSYVSITPATTYFLVFVGNSTLGITGDLSNPYPYGNVYANSGYTPFSAYDYAFRTYYETEVSLDRQTWAGVKTFFN
jgi:hypothetical protein